MLQETSRDETTTDTDIGGEALRMEPEGDGTQRETLRIECSVRLFVAVWTPVVA